MRAEVELKIIQAQTLKLSAGDRAVEFRHEMPEV